MFSRKKIYPDNHRRHRHLHPMLIGATTVIESSSVGPSNMAYNHTGPRLSMHGAGNTPMHAFTHDVSPDQASLVRRLISTHFFLSIDAWCWQCRRMPSFTTCPLTWQTQHGASSTPSSSRHTTTRRTNTAHPCVCASTMTTSTPATPTRHQPRRFSHSYADHGKVN